MVDVVFHSPTPVYMGACDKCSQSYLFTTKTDEGYTYLCWDHYFEDED